MNHNENDNKYAKEMYSRYYSLAIGCIILSISFIVMLIYFLVIKQFFDKVFVYFILIMCLFFIITTIFSFKKCKQIKRDIGKKK